MVRSGASKAAACAVAAMALVSAVVAKAPETDNTDVASLRAFARSLYLDKDVAGAYGRYAAAGLVEHDAAAETGRAAAIKAFEPLFANPAATFAVEHLAVDRNLAFISYHGNPSGAGAGAWVAELFRVSDGKAIEHWGAFQGADPADPHPCTSCDPKALPTVATDALLADRQKFEAFAKRLYSQRDAAGAYRGYAAATMTRHDTVSGDGRDQAIAAFADDQAKRSTRFEILHVMASRGFGLVHLIATDKDGVVSARFELFRIQGDLIVDQRSIVQQKAGPSAAASR
jgi:predicted SnoaL-like aldol condensation-catalyzing enzyme